MSIVLSLTEATLASLLTNGVGCVRNGTEQR
jgi:hypothetical protein